jgi:quinol monooxygenase YgiN
MATLSWTTPTAGDAPENREAVVMASRFDLLTLGQVPRFLLAALRVRRQMLASPGVLGVSLVANPMHKTFYTLSAWQNRDVLDAAVSQQPHAAVMAHFRPRMAASQFVFWTAPASELPPTWPDAMRRLAAASRGSGCTWQPPNTR